MRVASYNILDGGEGRADPLAEILIAQRADVIGIVEADNPAVLHRLSQRLGMDYVVAEGRKHAAALFSHWRIRDTINHALRFEDGPRCFLQAEVIEPSGMEWRFHVLHLSARATEQRERQREREIGCLMEVLAEAQRRGQPHLLLGDFNANSPHQQINPENCMERTREAWRENGGVIPRRAIQKLLDAGYLDTLQVVNPAVAQAHGTFTTQHPGQRVDYIFTFGVDRRRIVSAWIEQDRLAKYASDHFPVGCEIS